jgi:hypothetical protein
MAEPIEELKEVLRQFGAELSEALEDAEVGIRDNNPERTRRALIKAGVAADRLADL